MPSNQLLYLLYGNKTVYRYEAKFSILSALRNQKKLGSFIITLMTDSPEQFSGWPVNIVGLDEQTITACKGTQGYTHRLKACAIEVGSKLADKTIFVDTDTVFLSDPASLFDQVSDHKFLMDRFEWTWEEAIKRPSFAEFSADVIAKGQAPVDNLKLYNSGICGLTLQNSNLIKQAIDLIDEWSSYGKTLHTIEQIAISFMLADKQVSESYGKVNHYYAWKRYHHAMFEVFFKANGEDYSLTLLQRSYEVPSFKPLPSYFARLKVKIQLLSVDKDLLKAAKCYLYGNALRNSPYMHACRDIWWQRALESIRKRNPSQAKLRRLGDFWHGKNENSRFKAMLAEKLKVG